MRSLRAAHPRLFYEQEWFFGEAFMDRPLRHPLPAVPTSIVNRGRVPTDRLQPTAVELADLYVRTFYDPVWRNYLWTSDVDAHGQRVYVGVNGHGLEIHRHLAITDRWGVPLW